MNFDKEINKKCKKIKTYINEIKNETNNKSINTNEIIEKIIAKPKRTYKKKIPNENEINKEKFKISFEVKPEPVYI
jgi:uncharacterized protein YpuA (DUF1002 family)